MTIDNIKDTILDTALTLSEKNGWHDVSLSAIAQSAEIPLATLHTHFEDRFDILCYLGRTIDRDVLQNLSTYDETESPRDKLFDILMSRFDVLNKHRAAILSILNAFRNDPKQAVISLPYLGRSMTWMLEAADIDTIGIKGALRVTGLTGIYLKTLRVWRDDDSPDMAKTMAALDQNIAQGEKLARLFRLDTETQDSALRY